MPKITFGVKTGQGGYSYDDLKRVWAKAEQLGYDSAWLYDHFFALDDRNAPCLEAWTTLSALAAFTRKIKLGTMVTSVSYRHPSLLAKMAATLDCISDGRVILGIGAGWYEEEYHAYGYEFPNVQTRVRQLREALIVINKLWTEERASFDGKFFTLKEAASLPKPKQKPRPKMLVGISKGKKTLPYFAARYADGFNKISAPLQEYEGIMEVVRDTCRKSGRSFDDLIRSWQGSMLIGKSTSDVEQVVEKMAKERRQSKMEFRKATLERGGIVGTSVECTEQLQRLVDIGFNDFLLIFPNDATLRPLEIFRDEVVPQFK